MRVRHRFRAMPAAFPIRWQINLRGEAANRRLVVALIISLALHGLAYAGWRVAPPVVTRVKQALQNIWPRKFSELRPAPTPKVVEQPPLREVPMVFVEIDPALAAKEPPKETKNYSTDHSIAANPEPKKADVPKIDGSQKRVLRTIDAPKPKPQPLQPAPPEPKLVKPEPKEPAAKPPPVPAIGDLALNKPAPKSVEPPAKSDGEKATEKPREKPRTLREAMMRNPTIAGPKMQQDGGVKQRAHVAMVDARRSPFGNYDAVFISIVQERWYSLLENNQFMLDRRGKVSLTFRLFHDGRVAELKTAENDVGDVLGLLCEKSILDPMPFPPWPKEMRQIVGSNYRDLRFTFFYD